MIKLTAASTSAVSEPRPTVTATTDFPRFRDGAAFGAHGTDGRRHDRWYIHIGIGKSTKRKTRKQSMLGLLEDLSTYTRI